MLGSGYLHELNPCCLFICFWLIFSNLKLDVLLVLGVSTNARSYFYSVFQQAALHKHPLKPTFHKHSLHNPEDDEIALCKSWLLYSPVLQPVCQGGKTRQRADPWLEEAAHCCAFELMLRQYHVYNAYSNATFHLSELNQPKQIKCTEKWADS